MLAGFLPQRGKGAIFLPQSHKSLRQKIYNYNFALRKGEET